MGPGPAIKAAHSPGRPGLWAWQRFNMTDNANHPGPCRPPPPAGAVCWPPLAAALVLAGCMTQPVVPAPHAGVPVPEAFSAGGPSRRAARPGRWPRPLRRSLVANGGWVSRPRTGRAGAARRQRQHQHPASRWAPGRGPLAAALGRRRALSAGGRIGRVTLQAGAATTGSATPPRWARPGSMCLMSWTCLASCRKPAMPRGWTPMPAPRCCKARA